MFVRFLFASMFVAGAALTASGQDPFGGAAADPFGGAPAAPPVAAPPIEAQPIPAAPAADEHPTLQAVREQNPTTGPELMRAVQIALDLGEHDAAKEFIGQLQALNLDATAMFALVREFGSGAFVRLVRTPELAPQGRTFGLAALEAAAGVARDPARLRSVAERLNDPSPQMRRAALRELQAAGAAAVAPLTAIIANPIQAELHDEARAALASLGRAAIEPLMGVLEASDSELRAAAMEALGRLEARNARELLLSPAVDPAADPAEREAAAEALERIVGVRPHPDDARQLLAQEIRELLDGRLLRRADAEGMIELWHWNVAENAAVPRRYPAHEAGAVHAARLARELYEISQERIDDRRLYLEAILQAAKLQTGMHFPLPRGEGTAHAAAAEFGPAVVEDILHHAMAAGRVPAAIGAAEVLGDIGSQSLLHSGSAAPAPLTAALRHKNQRLRLAAGEAIVKIDPTEPFADSDRYVATLASLVRTEILPRALVADPREENAQTLAGLLTRMGFEADVAYNGRQAYELAARHPDHTILLLSDALNDPPVRQLVELLRQDFRTADLPIGVMYRTEIEPLVYTSETDELLDAATQTGERLPGLHYDEDRLLAAQTIAFGDPLIVAIPQIYDPVTLDFAATRLTALAPHGPVLPVERLRFAGVAIDALGRYAAAPVKYSFYRLPQVQESVVKAIDLPDLAVPAARALGSLGTTLAQQSLVNVASQHARPLEVRQAAAEAFREAVARQNLQLTTDEILLQYDRYNRSERLDPETQAVLGHVLDTLEGVGEEPPASPPADAKAPPSSS
ncbi:MAG: hypothetical protein KY475_03005 [Planctomycetes bacterium]|nr:hypothetical protein [Planctomycetota bacterium]